MMDGARRIGISRSIEVTQLELATQQNGFRLAASIGGTLTGRGGDVLIIDDPHKADEVNSDAKRQAVLDWYEQTAATRLDDPRTGIVIIFISGCTRQTWLARCSKRVAGIT